MKTKKNIAILGATSHIAKGLIENFSKYSACQLFLFARTPSLVKEFVQENIPAFNNYRVADFTRFNKGNYAVVINCVGLGTPDRLRKEQHSIFQLTEAFDDLVLNYLEKKPGTLYINFSSGAVYGMTFPRPIGRDSNCTLPINALTGEDYYAIAKINAEAKHRMLAHFKIIDLRVFSYFSKFIDLNAGYLLTDIIQSIKTKKVLITDDQNIVRDYVHPQDIFQFIEKCIKKAVPNIALDIYSARPIKKFELLAHFQKNYGLKYRIRKTPAKQAPSRSKLNYYSTDRTAAKVIRYTPTFTSLQCIQQTVEFLLR